jgi:hypothetical protein
MNMGKEQPVSPEFFQKLQYLADIEIQKIGESNPARLFIPNVGQERALSVYRKNNGTLLGVPFTHVFGGGNGVGKTTALVILLVGLCFGVEELNDEWFGDYEVFKKMDRIRTGETDGRPRAIKGRIVCHPDSMKVDGPVYGELMKWFPKGRFELTKGGKTYYSILNCYDEDGNLLAEVGIKSHEQDKGAHAGANLDFVLCDEPMPESLWGETIARVRGGGFIALFLTPLEVSAWMISQIIERIDGKIRTLSNGSIWDNCIEETGARGHLHKEHILNLIEDWKRLSPEEVDARVSGSFTHLSGAIYKVYNPVVHLIEPFKIPEDWPIYMIIDPHPSRPPAATWYAQGPVRTYAIAEYPTEDYTRLKNTDLTIEHFCAEFKRIERVIGRKANYRYGDPNALVVKNNNTKGKARQVKDQYGDLGFKFNLASDNLQVGHDTVKQHLYYDAKMELSYQNSPKFYVFMNCYNINTSLRSYGFKNKTDQGGSLSSRIDQKYKDFADNVRYFFSKLKHFMPVTEGENSFVKRLKNSRNSNNYK